MSNFFPSHLFNRAKVKTEVKESKESKEPAIAEKEVALKNIEASITNLINDNKMLYDKQRTELVDLLNSVINSQEKRICDFLHQNLMSASESITSAIKPHFSYQNDVSVMKKEVPEVSKAREIAIRDMPEKGKKKPLKKYEKMAPSIWENVRKEYPDLPEELSSQAYITKDGNYIKIGTMYYVISPFGLSIILKKLKHA